MKPNRCRNCESVLLLFSPSYLSWSFPLLFVPTVRSVPSYHPSARFPWPLFPLHVLPHLETISYDIMDGPSFVIPIILFSFGTFTFAFVLGPPLNLSSCCRDLKHRLNGCRVATGLSRALVVSWVVVCRWMVSSFWSSELVNSLRMSLISMVRSQAYVRPIFFWRDCDSS